MNTSITQCPSCGAAIIWRAHMRTGKAAPIDADPCERGNLLCGTSRYRIISTPDERAMFAGQLHLNHYVTCGKPPKKGGKD